MSIRLTTSHVFIPVSLLAATISGLASGAEPAKEFAAWLGKENTVDISGQDDHLPKGGKFTLVYDAQENVVRVCARSASTQAQPWREEMAQPCQVALNFVRGERYCNYQQVKTGDAEVLASCHRLRNTDVALHPAKSQRDNVERHDVILYLLEPTLGAPLTAALTIDSPSSLTHSIFGGHVHQ